MTTLSDDLPAAAAPCPAWCDRTAGHPYDSSDGFVETRDHSQLIAAVDYLEQDRERIINHRAQVSIESLEELSLIDGSVQTDPALIWLYAVEGSALTGPQARQIAAALLNAADTWDRLQ